MTTTAKNIESLRTKRITLEGITGQGTGDRVEAVALPAPSPRRLAHRGVGDGDHWQGWAEIPFAGRGGGLYPRKRRRKTPHYGLAPMYRGLENSTPNPIHHHP